MEDRSRESKCMKNLKRTIITPLIYVSSASLPRSDWWGDYDLIETWIFSNDLRLSSHQIFHNSEEDALKVHGYIAENLKITLGVKS